MKNQKKHMKISQLSELAKKPASTIRYYVKLGLLPEPIISGKTMSYYTREHLTRLNRIDTLKERGLSLAEISESLNQDSDETHPVADTGVMHMSKREVIIRAAIASFREKGYDLTNINDIIGRACVGKGTFYQYFKGKEDLFFECAENIFYDIAKIYPEISNELDGFTRLGIRSRLFLKSHLHMISMLNLLRVSSLKNTERITAMLSGIMKTITDPVKSDLQEASDQGKIHFGNIDFLACMLMGVSEYMSYYFQMYPEKDVDAVHTNISDIMFHTISHDQDYMKDLE